MESIEVTRECVRSYLLGVRAAQAECRALEQRIAERRDALDGLRSAAPGPGGSSDGDALGRGVAALMDLERMWADKAEEAAQVIAEAYRRCDPAGDVWRHAVWRHEVERQTWTEIAASLGYGESSCRRRAAEGYRSIYDRIPATCRREAFPKAAPDWGYTES